MIPLDQGSPDGRTVDVDIKEGEKNTQDPSFTFPFQANDLSIGWTHDRPGVLRNHPFRISKKIGHKPGQEKKDYSYTDVFRPEKEKQQSKERNEKEVCVSGHGEGGVEKKKARCKAS
jgi:hypothetical protein